MLALSFVYCTVLQDQIFGSCGPLAFGHRVDTVDLPVIPIFTWLLVWCLLDPPGWTLSD